MRAVIAQQAQARGLARRVAPLPWPLPLLVGDALRLKQVLLNFLSNAEKFTAHGGVALEATVVEQAKQHLTLRQEQRETKSAG